MSAIKYGFFGILTVFAVETAVAGSRDNFVSSRSHHVSSRDKHVSSRSHHVSSREKLAREKNEEVGVPYDDVDREYDLNKTINPERYRRAEARDRRDAKEDTATEDGVSEGYFAKEEEDKEYFDREKKYFPEPPRVRAKRPKNF